MVVTNPFNALRSWTRAHVEAVSRGWWVLLVTGLLSVVAGGILVVNDWTVGDLAAFIGALLVFRGIFTLFSFPVDGSARTWSVVMGLAELGVGGAVWVWPGQTLLVVAFFIGWLLLFRGVTAISGAFVARRFMPYWGWILALGIGEVLVSSYLLARPGLTLVATVLAIGFASIFYGAIEIMLSFEVKNLPQYFDQLTSTLEARVDPRPLQRTSA